MNYTGTYNRIKNRLIPTDKTKNPLFIRARKKDTITKPKQFLLEKVGNKYVYVSSLYPTTEGNTEKQHYKFDNRQIVFDIQITDEQAIIQELK